MTWKVEGKGQLKFINHAEQSSDCAAWLAAQSTRLTDQPFADDEYETPEFEVIEEALDIAILFVMSASAMFIPFDDVLEFTLADQAATETPVTHMTAGLNREPRGVFYTVYAYEPGGYGGHCVGQCEIPSGHVLFEAMVKISASLMLRYKVTQAFRDFDAAYARL